MHAARFPGARSCAPGSAGREPASIATEAALTLDEGEGGFAITAVHW